MRNILIACEESQAVCTAFRERGFNAYSCDLQRCGGNHPEWHILGDALEAMRGGRLKLQDGSVAEIGGWDLMIAHPPCTYMSKAGARWMYPKAGQISPERLELAMLAKDFFLKFLNAEDIPCIAVENPRPLKVVGLPACTQVIQPYEYGEPYSKATLLWLKGLPKLVPTDILAQHTPYLPSNTGSFSRGGGGSRGVAHDAKTASRTFRGIAEAMAAQWGDYLLGDGSGEKPSDASIRRPREMDVP